MDAWDKQKLRVLMRNADRMRQLAQAIEEADIEKAEDAIDEMAVGLMEMMEVWEKMEGRDV